MINLETRETVIKPDFVSEQYDKFKHAVKHDDEMETLISYLNDPDEMSEIFRDLKGTRKIIFSLMLDLGLIPQEDRRDHENLMRV